MERSRRKSNAGAGFTPMHHRRMLRRVHFRRRWAKARILPVSALLRQAAASGRPCNEFSLPRTRHANNPPALSAHSYFVSGEHLIARFSATFKNFAVGPVLVNALDQITSIRNGRGGQPLGPVSLKPLDGLKLSLPWLERRLAGALLRLTGKFPLRVQVGRSEPVASASPAVASVKIRDAATLIKLLAYPDLNFGEGYIDGSIEVEGDLTELLEARARARLDRLGSRRAVRIAALVDSTRANTLAGSRHNIHHHYDLGNEFYRLWLDDEMVYTCAYFPRPWATLEAAQLAKLDHVCRKLQLQRGDRLVEAGCGWGALALHAATRYGARVRAFNISREQLAFARYRAQALGVAGRCEFIEDDYRNLSGRYDAFVSVGMLEHVGREHYDELGRAIDRCLTDEGRGLIHSIGQNLPLPLNAWIEKRIFPGAYPPTLREIVSILEPVRCSVLDVENLRPHYALTIEHWLERFEANRERIAAMYDEAFVRAWRLYLSGSIAAFRAGTLQLFQVLFTRAGARSALWTREHLYRSAE